MKKLQELLSLREQQETFEISEIVKTFPNKKDAEKHIRNLWGTPKLTYKGNVVLGDDRDVFAGLEEAAEKIKDELEVDVGNNAAYDDELLVKIGDWQEVYLGFDPKTGNLFQGYDCWLDEEDFNSHVEYHDDEPDGGKEFKALWKEFQDASPWVLIEMRSQDGKHFKAIDYKIGRGQHGMFYSAGHREAQHRGLIDLRLD